ncbi:hypothetical protein K435DRAFT_27502 [Dendrothele bispora CBS 962.96]|uniref:Uncharacterized protein n=1 Tax=Dendrothele bispora (strain CBS 962.96) TaxID=1314807 RepID=A0A4S8KUB7_DENBC|nr:hypothetical protein K435DRAFT_27502 [Dendrothele bispora CBS 962.96]
MSSSNIPPGVNLAAVAGPLLIGELLHWGLFGTLTVQIYLYYLTPFPRDKTILKVMAYFVYTLELVQTILVTNDAFRAYGSGFGNYDELTAMHTYWLTVPIMSGIVSLIGQLFFGYRIWFCPTQGFYLGWSRLWLHQHSSEFRDRRICQRSWENRQSTSASFQNRCRHVVWFFCPL